MNGHIATEMYEAYVHPERENTPLPLPEPPAQFTDGFDYSLPLPEPPAQFTEGFDYSLDPSNLKKEGIELPGLKARLEEHLSPRRAVARNVAVAIYLGRITYDPKNLKSVGKRFACDHSSWTKWLVTVLGKETEARKTIITNWYTENNIETDIVKRGRYRQLEAILIVVATKLGGQPYTDKAGLPQQFKVLSKFDVYAIFSLTDYEYKHFKTTTQVLDHRHKMAADLSQEEAIAWFNIHKKELLTLMTPEIDTMLRLDLVDVCT
jgi:hypothetical protein